ncbi:hypothetical protein EVAR_45269_1 [Eumeta japonica]|uniref:Uncharacterized protein n=1 Tax=Eumeta variegata TaxID=151549 RepID=A0A4C1XG26_EUMVA|nr:hypothetical protein EVAR_45269_1 [Eumeta japonica]
MDSTLKGLNDKNSVIRDNTGYRGQKLKNHVLGVVKYWLYTLEVSHPTCDYLSADRVFRSLRHLKPIETNQCTKTGQCSAHPARAHRPRTVTGCLQCSRAHVGGARLTYIF